MTTKLRLGTGAQNHDGQAHHHVAGKRLWNSLSAMQRFTKRPGASTST